MSDSPVSPDIVIPEWLTHLINASEIEERETHNMSLVRQGGRNIIWNWTRSLGCRKKGVAGQACRLLERYFFFSVRSIIQTMTLSPDLQEAVVANVVHRILLLISCCVQLAVKMSGSMISPRRIQLVLLKRGYGHSLEEIIQTEIDIFSTIGYRVPLQNSVEIAEQLAVEIGLPSVLMKAITIIMDIAENRRYNIECKVRIATAGTDHSGYVRTLHLCAGSVAATATYYAEVMSTLDVESLVVQLAKLVAITPVYLECIASIIYQILNSY